jgi:membrane fusion protein (multidrug efflux system)
VFNTFILFSTEMIHQFSEYRLRYSSAIFLLTAMLTCSCARTEESAGSYDTFAATYPLLKDTSYSHDYVADIQSVQNVEIRSRVSGYIESIHADEGAFVKAGQLLFTVSSQEYKQELLKAKAMLSSAIADTRASEMEVNNVKRLVEKNVVSESELKLAQAKLEALQARVEEAKAQVANAELQLSFAQVRAPFSGVINRIPNKIGSLVEDGTLLTSLSDNNEVFAYFNVSEIDYLDIVANETPGSNKEAFLILANNQPHRYSGKIETVEGEVDKSTGNIAFRARFSNPDLLLKHGSTGKVRLFNKITQALLVPQKSTFEIQDNVYVFVIDQNNTIKLRSFTPKLRIPHFYVVESGLTSNDRILYEGIQQVKEGDVVNPQVIQMENIIAQIAEL